MQDAIGRPVRIGTLSRPPTDNLMELVAEVRDVAEQGPADLIVLPETCRGQSDTTYEPAAGPTVEAMRELARTHHTYLLCPIDRFEDERRSNSAVLIDRDGGITDIYEKMYPYWPELDLDPPVRPGPRAAVWDTDFGKLGVAICFDINFAAVWQDLADHGAELVVWPSAYAGGSILGAYARIHHYYVVSCTQAVDCRVYDVTGDEVLHSHGGASLAERITLDLDRGIYHENFNMEKLRRLLDERPDDVELEAHLEPEQWFVLRARRRGVSVRRLAAEYGLEELRTYVSRSRATIDGRRGDATDRSGVSGLIRQPTAS